ncbi:MAG: hypothetical protein Phog2KO_17550 [Phototrophicaceae bacterium]
MSATTFNKTSSQQQVSTRTLPSAWQIIVGTLGIVTVLAFVVYLVTAINFRNRSFIGATLTHTLVVNAGRPTGNEAWTGLNAGLMRNDRVVAINGESLYPTDALTDFATARSNYNSILDSLAPDTAIDVTVLRRGTDLTGCTGFDSELSSCTYSIIPSNNFPDVDFLAYFVLPYLTGLLQVGLGILVFWYRSSTREGIIAIAIAFGSALYTGGMFDIGTQAVLAPMWVIGASTVSASMLILGMNFPTRLKELRNKLYIDYAILLIFGLISVYLIFQFLNLEDAWKQVEFYTPIITFVGVIGVVGIWAINLIQRQRAKTPTTRDQANTLFIGTTLMLLPVFIWVISRGITLPNGSPIVPFNLEAIIILTIFPIGAITYAVLQYRVIDSERAISRGITYSIMGSILIIGMYLVVLGGALLSIDILNASNNALLIALILFTMVIFFTPLRNILQARIDKIYYREQRDLQANVQTFNREITSLNDYQRIINLYYTSVKETLLPTAIHIFLREGPNGDFTAYQVNGSKTDIRFTADSPLIEILAEQENNLFAIEAGEKWIHSLRIDQPRLRLLKAQVIIGLAGRNNLIGFVLLAPPSQKTSYSYEEISYLTDVTSQLSIATERAQVIGTLERRVQELDVLSQVGQAVNFTVELDDLLELLYNQTTKLLPVPNFYIVLYEEKINRLYFAFFLEGDDRFENKENVRWIVDNDLFSEVIKKNSALRVNNFTAEMKKRGAELTLVESGLLEWMGIPLNAGRDTLGVMAAGKRRDSSEYTDEQFKIFSDVAALAATSLERASLFNQTRIRQRQLTVLNDISRQLVATETDVEKLLSIIMSSAVDILNGEAGSLLLNTEDDSGDLEFRVVIGGGGDELLKTRVPKGQGVVGRVVETSEPIIVNDTETDPNHNEVTDDFVSHSLLAVPLTAKDEVIGVLEVINKKDGTPFVQEDASLLTTFAGQAAVAIENARLFQQTDQQLSQRVKELETLERMDAELNRTHELADVAEITVRQSMDILGANAGALGIIHENPPYLEIVAIKGYERSEYPPDAEGEDGLIWQLNSGVVKRVMRTRRADIALDFHLDPDYVPGLTNSNSQITLPMLAGDKINAILILEKNTEPRFNLPDWAFAQRIAEHASIAVANAQFYLALDNAMKSKSEFMGFAAHELNNPLASVKGFADVMLSGMTGDITEQQSSFLTTIKSNANRMQVLIGDLRDAAKIDADEFTVDAEPMNIRSAVVETLRPFVTMLTEKNQELVNNVPEDLPLIWGDEVRVIQVLTNLVSNAHKYSHNDTTITVGGEVRENYVDRQGNKRGKMVVVYVQDQGIGMSNEDQQKLFKERYFRSTNNEAREMATGTGLGMTLTYNIMIKHQGEIWIESVMGEGSTFLISFPLAEDMRASIEKREGVGN